MEGEEQQEDASRAEGVEHKQEEATVMESGEEQGGEEMAAVEAGRHQDVAAIDALMEREDAVMESLPVEVKIDKLRGEREKAPDNAEERVVNEGIGGLGFPGEKVVKTSDEEEGRGVDLEGVGVRNGTEQQLQAEGEVEEGEFEEGEVEEGEVEEGEVEKGEFEEGEFEEGEIEGQVQEDVEAEGNSVMAGNDAETEVEMIDAAAVIDDEEGEAEEGRSAKEKLAGVETNGTRTIQASNKRSGLDALDYADGVAGVKRPKKKTNSWSKSTTRNTNKKSKPVKISSGKMKEECIEVNPAQWYLLKERSGIQLSKDKKAEKVELSLDKMQASSEEGYRMDSRGLLSQLVEDEVGLWTTDVGDEQITSSKADTDEDRKKKVRAPISAERKLKKKVAFRRKRAEKEKELGIRRPRLPVNTFKPKVPLCKFYIKGRCTLGEKCTFSHDVVPITKSDPCKFFMVNRCLKGDDCPFSHTLDTFPCKFWHTRGHCLDGNNCRFSHGPLTDDQRQNLVKRIEHDSKEQLNVPDIPTDFNNAPEDSESEYLSTLNSSQTEALGWDVNPPQSVNQDTACCASTSIASQSILNNKEVPPAAPRTSFVANQSSLRLGEVNREEIQLADTYKEDTPAENAVLLAARKAASAAAVQAAGTTDKLLLSRSGSPTNISLPKSRSFGRSLAGRGTEASAMDLLQASLSSDDRHDLSQNASSSSLAFSNTGTLSASALSSAGAGGDMLFPSSSPLSRATPSNLGRGSSFGHSKQVVAPGIKASAMELLQASLRNETTPDDNSRGVDILGL